MATEDLATIFAFCLGVVDMRQGEVRVSISEEAVNSEERTDAVGAPSLRMCLSTFSRSSQPQHQARAKAQPVQALPLCTASSSSMSLVHPYTWCTADCCSRVEYADRYNRGGMMVSGR